MLLSKATYSDLNIHWWRWLPSGAVLGFGILSKITLTCRPRESKQRPAETQALPLSHNRPQESCYVSKVRSILAQKTHHGKFCGDPISSFCVILLTNQPRQKHNLLGGIKDAVRLGTCSIWTSEAPNPSSMSVFQRCMQNMYLKHVSDDSMMQIVNAVKRQHNYSQQTMKQLRSVKEKDNTAAARPAVRKDNNQRRKKNSSAGQNDNLLTFLDFCHVNVHPSSLNYLDCPQRASIFSAGLVSSLYSIFHVLFNYICMGKASLLHV